MNDGINETMSAGKLKRMLGRVGPTLYPCGARPDVTHDERRIEGERLLTGRMWSGASWRNQ